MHYHLPCGLKAVEAMRCVVPAGKGGYRQAGAEHPTAAPVLTGAEKLSTKDAKKVINGFEASKVKFMTKCANAR